MIDAARQEELLEKWIRAKISGTMTTCSARVGDRLGYSRIWRRTGRRHLAELPRPNKPERALYCREWLGGMATVVI